MVEHARDRHIRGPPQGFLRAGTNLASADARSFENNLTEVTMEHTETALYIRRAQQLQSGGLKVDFSDGTCAFLTLEQLTALAPVRPSQTAQWPAGASLVYCCYDGCEFCT